MTTNPTPNPIVIGYDPGNGNTSVATGLRQDDGHYTITTSSVQSSVGHHPTPDARKRKRKLKNVVFDGDEYLVGPGVSDEADPLAVVLSEYHTPARLALFYAALADILPPNQEVNALVVIGLPVNVRLNKAIYEDSQSPNGAVAKGLKSKVSEAYKRRHQFTVNGKNYVLNVVGMEAVDQPFGTYKHYRYDNSLQPIAEREGSVLIFDIGMGTSDVTAVEEDPKTGKVTLAGRYTSGNEDTGVHWLLSAIHQEMGIDLAEVDTRLRDGRVSLKLETLDLWLNDLMAQVRWRGKRLKDFNATLPSGGGVLLLGDKLKFALQAKGANVVWPEDPILSNVIGFWKHGQRKLNKKLDAEHVRLETTTASALEAVVV